MSDAASPPRRFADVRNVRVPALSYGTAWKEERTAPLVRAALAAGFRGIDTANQRKHYVEAAVGDAVREALAAGLSRDALFLQTKFTFVDGQDHRLPYDPDAPVAKQVEQSFASSLEHLGVDRLDSYVLHGPSTRGALGADDWEAWRAMEALHGAGRTRLLGVSNVTLAQLEELCSKAAVAPSIVQNRCYAARGWDRGVRTFCRERGILYQAFSLLTGTPDVVRHSKVAAIAARLRRTPAEVIFAFAIQAGMIALTGTTDPAHMKQDLSVFDFALDPAEVRTIESLIA